MLTVSQDILNVPLLSTADQAFVAQQRGEQKRLLAQGVAWVTQDLKSKILGLPVISDFLQRILQRSLVIAEVSMTVSLGDPKLLKENPPTYFGIGNDRKF